jgi:hypothetical protein
VSVTLSLLLYTDRSGGKEPLSAGREVGEEAFWGVRGPGPPPLVSEALGVHQLTASIVLCLMSGPQYYFSCMISSLFFKAFSHFIMVYFMYKCHTGNFAKLSE